MSVNVLAWFIILIFVVEYKLQWNLYIRTVLFLNYILHVDCQNRAGLRGSEYFLKTSLWQCISAKILDKTLFATLCMFESILLVLFSASLVFESYQVNTSKPGIQKKTVLPNWYSNHSTVMQLLPFKIQKANLAAFFPLMYEESDYKPRLYPDLDHHL